MWNKRVCTAVCGSQTSADTIARFYDEGYKDGYAHGRIHGLIEGRALGREKGYEMWEELGFYEGFALAWQAIHNDRQNPEDEFCILLSSYPYIHPMRGSDNAYLSQAYQTSHQAPACLDIKVPTGEPKC